MGSQAEVAAFGVFDLGEFVAVEVVDGVTVDEAGVDGTDLVGKEAGRGAEQVEFGA
jgi:hypothetical protein